MSKLLTFILIFITSVSVVSCGAKKNSKTDSDAGRAYMEAIVSSKSCGGSIVSEISRKISALSSTVSELSVDDPILRIQQKNRKSSIDKTLEFSQTVLSERILSERIETLKELLDSKKDIKVSYEEFRKIAKMVQKLRINFDRWSFHQCHLTSLIDNNSKELNDFIELETLYCEKGCISSLMPERFIEGEEKREKAINVCSLLNRRSYCKVHYDIAKVYSGEDEFIKEILNKARIFFDQEVFGMTDSPLEIECTESEKKKLIIPIYQNSNSVSLMTAISENWKNDDILIEFKLGSSGVRLELVDSGLSRVALNDLSTIYLNKNLVGVQKIKTIAHEFGHTLGFRDCYIEYYDTKSSEVIYYELERDKGNLMCSLEFGTKIPEKYLKKVVSKYCE